MTTNPFSFGKPIFDPARFCNRVQETRQIVNRLQSSAHESTSVVGERRIGKTSLLNYLANPKTTAELGLPPNQFCLIYVDFQGLTEITPEKFWNRVLGKMAKSICRPELASEIEAVRGQEAIDQFDLEDLFDKINQSGLNIVLLMDEFEAITQNPAFGADFFGGLRALAIHSGLALVTATREELVDLCHSEDIKSSPFFNIFATVVLRPFTREETYIMIETYLRTIDIIFTPEEKELIAVLGGGQPIFTQIAGYYLVEWKKQGLSGAALVERVTADFNHQADPHFQYLWSHCSESEKVTLMVVMVAGRSNAKGVATEKLVKARPRSANDITSLVRRGMLIEENGQLRLLTPGLERWISAEVSAEPGAEETETTARDWAKSLGEKNASTSAGDFTRFKKKYWPEIAIVIRELSFDVLGMSIFEIIKVLLHIA